MHRQRDSAWQLRRNLVPRKRFKRNIMGVRRLFVPRKRFKWNGMNLERQLVPDKRFRWNQSKRLHSDGAQPSSNKN